MIYIECLGIHGAGKTTVTQAFIRALQAKRQTIWTEKSIEIENGWQDFIRRIGMFRTVLAPLLSGLKTQIGNVMCQRMQGDLMQQFILMHPRLMQIVMDGVLKLEMAHYSAQQMLENFLQTAAVYQLTQHNLHEQDMLIIEEGFCQQAYHALAAQVSEVSDDALTTYLCEIPRPSYILSIATPPEECEIRLRMRPKYPRILENLSFEEKITYLRQREAFHQRIISLLTSRWHIPQIEIFNIQDKEPYVAIETSLPHLLNIGVRAS